MSVNWNGMSIPPYRWSDWGRHIAIYVLRDPITEEVRYVGQSHDPEARYRQHLKTFGKKCNPEKAQWINMVLQQGLYPDLSVVCIVKQERAYDVEMLLIAALAPIGRLTNQRYPTSLQHQRRLRRVGVSDQWMDSEEEFLKVTRGYQDN